MTEKERRRENRIRIQLKRISSDRSPHNKSYRLFAKKKVIEIEKKDREREYMESILLKYTKIDPEPLSGEEGLKCSHFGCPKTLSLIEKLSGSKCVHHMNIIRHPYA